MTTPNHFDEDTFDLSLVDRWSDRTCYALTSIHR